MNGVKRSRPDQQLPAIHACLSIEMALDFVCFGAQQMKPAGCGDILIR